MRYNTGDWIPGNQGEVLFLQKTNAKKKMISSIKKKCIKVPVMENPTPLAIGYIMLKNGMFIEVLRNWYRLMFFQEFIEFYTGEKDI